MLASAVSGKSEFIGLRPFNPLRDIKPIIKLIELSFGEDLEPSSRRMLNEMRTLSWLLGPVLWLLSKTKSPLASTFGGYVWLEEGRIVGNITVHTRYKGRMGWFISNLAVHPDYRRQDIAFRLVTEGLELARTKGAQRVSLEVRAKNVTAQGLYRKLGFTKVDSVSRMRLSRVPGVDRVPAGEYRIRALQADGWRKVYQLALDTISPEAREILSVEEKDYRSSFPQRLVSGLGDLLKGQAVYRWAALKGDRFLGLANLRAGGMLAPHSLTMMVHPDHRGEVEEILLTKALSTLNAYPSRPLSASIQPSYEGIVEVFAKYGFVEVETLDLLTLRLQ